MEDWQNYWKDYYKILQVDFAAEQEVINGAFNRLAKKYHPDISKNPHALERMKDINEAYEYLGNPDKKSVYDLEWHQKKGSDAPGKSSYQPPRSNANETDFEDTQRTNGGNYHWTPPNQRAQSTGGNKPPFEKSSTDNLHSKKYIWAVAIVIIVGISATLVLSNIDFNSQPSPLTQPTTSVKTTPLPLTAGTYILNTVGVISYTATASSWGVFEYKTFIDGQMMLEKAIVEGNTIRIYLALTFDTIVAADGSSALAGWEPSHSNTIPTSQYLTDNKGNTYNSISEGGDFATKQTFRSGEVKQGYHVFRGPSTIPSGATFYFHSWWLKEPTQFLLDPEKMTQ